MPGEYFAHIDDFDFGQISPAKSLLKFNVKVLAGMCVMIGLHRGSGASQNDYCIGPARSDNRRVASMITRRFFLFIRCFVLFVDDNQPEVLEWRKNCRTRADADTRLALSDAVPFVQTFAFGER